MRHTIPVTCLLAGALFTGTLGFAQPRAGADSTGVPGDNFSLQGALEMFKKAHSPEDFEKLINQQDNHVNNLDLNGDGNIDYVRVIGKKDGDSHIFVLQVPVSEKESQDIAVIALEKSGNENAILQIIGDEDIYGEETIVEPDGGGEDEGEAETEVEEEGKGPSVPAYSPALFAAPRIVVNVWPWPIVRFVYAPTYTVWVSPWRWRVYPGWWRPWRPLAWHAFHPFRVRYRTGFAVVHTHRVVHANRIYRPTRVTSVTVRTRHHGAVNKYRVTKTTTVRTKGGATKVKRTKTTTRVRTKKR